MDTKVYRIRVYQDGGTWMFDDLEHRFRGEPFLFGMEVLLDQFSARIPRAKQGFHLYIADHQFPGSVDFLNQVEEDAGGYWYYSPTYRSRGWMGNSGLTRYFEKAPEILYVKAEPLEEHPPASGD